MSTDILHSHCDSCYRQKCTVVTDPPCPVISCHNVCGASFHECKASEHHKLCLQEKVPCINVENGCPMVMLRCELNEHLSVCPASVVCCTMEWCRWPMYSREHGTSVPFAPSSLRARCGQLDVALALRDQRTLDRARRYPRRSLVRALRNRITRRHPTVPLLVGGNPTFETLTFDEFGEFEFSDSEDENMEGNSRAPWLTSEPPGLKKSILGELFGEPPSKSAANGNASKLDAEDIHCALCSPRSRHLFNTSVQPTANSDIILDCQNNDCITCPETSEEGSLCLMSSSNTVLQLCLDSENLDCSDKHQLKFGCLLSDGSQSTHTEEACLSNLAVTSQEVFQESNHISKMSICGSDLQETKQAVEGGLPTSDTNNSNSCIVPGNASDDINNATGYIQTVRLAEALNTTTVMDSVRSPMDDPQCPCPNSFDDDTSGQIVEPQTKNGIKATSVQGSAGSGQVYGPHSEVSDGPPTLHEVLSVDLELVTCGRGSVRDPSVYSFICAQLFRRDEFSQHFHDVHSMLSDALDWLEYRCPLAHRGCTFSMRQRQPTGASIVFSHLLESIGLRRTDAATAKTASKSEFELDSSVICSAIQVQQQLAKLPLYTPNKQVVSADRMFTSANYGSTVVTAIGDCTSQEDGGSESGPKSISILAQSRGEETGKVRDNMNGSKYAYDRSTVKQPVGSMVKHKTGFKEGTPIMFTSREFDSMVCIQPRMSKEPTPDSAEDTPPLSLSDLPHEMLARIASFLDPFSLCNLSLTCWLLRDVCRSLLRHRGIVVLEWHRNCSRSLPLWKVSHKVSLLLNYGSHFLCLVVIFLYIFRYLLLTY